MEQRWKAPTPVAVAQTGAPTRDAVLHGAPSPAREAMVVQIDRLAPGLVLIKVQGAIDARTAPRLRQHLLGVTAPVEVFTRLLLDLSGVSLLDRSGLDALLHLQDRWGPGAGSVELLAPSPSVVRLLHEADLNGESQINDEQ